MESSKTITIYDIPVEPVEKLMELETGTMNPEMPRPEKKIVEEAYADSSIPSILLKNIIFNCVPIESADPQSRGSNAVDGGAVWMTHVQFPVPVLTFVSGHGFTVRAAGDTIRLIGIMFDSTRSYLQVPHVFYNWKNTSIQDQGLAGVLGLRSLAVRYKNSKVPRVANFFTHDLVFSDHGPDEVCQPLVRKKLVLRFHSDQDAIQKIQMIQDFLLGRQLHYGLSLGRTMDSLGDLVKRRISFLETQKPTPRGLVAADKYQSAVIKLLPGDHNKSVAARASGLIYSSHLEDLYVALVSSRDQDMVRAEEKIIKTIGTKKNVRSSRKSAIIEIKMAESWRGAISRREFQKPADELSPPEAEVVKAAYEREHSHAAAMITNKCPHNGHYKKVMTSRSTTFDTLRWQKLRDFLDLPKLTAATPDELPKFESMIQCAQCKFSAICPHNFIMFEYVTKFFNGDDTRCLNWIADNYTEAQSISDGRYCKICGELLMKISIESETWLNLSKSSTGDDPIDTVGILINDEVAETLNANLDLSKSSINRTAITHSIANSIDPWVRRYDLKLRRVKTNTELDITLSLGLIVAIYTLMSIAHLIALAGPAGSGISIKTILIREEAGLKMLHTLFNGIYKLLTVQRSAVIEKIIAFTPDRIKKIMTRAYGQISGAPVVIETVSVEYHTDLITDNPYFQFLAYLWRLGELLENPNSREVIPAKNDTPELVIGCSVAELNKMRDFFSKATLAPKWKPHKDAESPKPWIDYCWKAYSTYAERLITGKSMVDAANAPGIHAEYAELMKLRSSLVYGTSDDINAKYIYDRKNLGRSVNPEKAAYDFKIPEDLTRVFCPDTGKLHEWKLFILTGPEGKSAELKSSDFKSLKDKPGKFKTMKCVNCGLVTCGGGPAKTESVNDAIKLRSRDRGFFSYYKVRCPVGWFHVFADGKCSKCSLGIKMTGEESAAYLEKYLQTYESGRKSAREKESAAIIESARRTPGMVVVRKVPKSNFKPWVSQNGPITTASKTWSQLPYNLLINIGLTGSSHWIQIVNGKVNPSNSAEDVEILGQATSVGGYISLIAVSYNRFTTCATRGMHPDLVEFCERRSDEVRSLEMINLGDFYVEQGWREKNDKPNGYSNWCINQLCELLIKINSAGPLSKRFAEIMVDQIVTSEMNMSKPVIYKNIMIAAAKSAANLDAAGDEIEAPETDVEAKEFIKSIASDGESFSSDAMDIDDAAASRGDDDI